MTATCFSCHKKLSTFTKRGDKKILIRAGYKPLLEMSDVDVLCQDCLDQIKKTQEKGRGYKEQVSIGWQVFITFIFPLYTFWRIEKLTKAFLYNLIFSGGIMLYALGVIFSDPDNLNKYLLSSSSYRFYLLEMRSTDKYVRIRSHPLCHC